MRIFLNHVAHEEVTTRHYVLHPVVEFGVLVRDVTSSRVVKCVRAEVSWATDRGLIKKKCLETRDR
jgi:hypothetical protein